MSKLDEIKKITPLVCYFCGDGETVPPPINSDTASMTFIEQDGYTVGFSGSLVDAERKKIKCILKFGTEAPNYTQLRKVEYPPLEDFADAFYWSQHGDEKPMRDWLAACDAVKEKYKK